jgi:uncharacterized protein (TIGR03437 family)
MLDASSGQMTIAALDENNHVVNSQNPVRRGHPLQLYVNGLGTVSGNQPASGALTPASPLAPTALIPTVTIGGQQATVLFSGLAPLSVGLYQVNAVVPVAASPGVQKVVISIGGVTSRVANVPVQ